MNWSIELVEDNEVSVMNISQLKASLGDNPQHLSNKYSIQNQLRDAGLEQAITEQFSSITSLGVWIFSNALNNMLEVDKRNTELSASDIKKFESSVFDFKEIAKNVLKGIKLAEQDLAGFLNEEITNGISQSKTLIEDGIAKLKDNIFDPQAFAPQKVTQ